MTWPFICQAAQLSQGFVPSDPIDVEIRNLTGTPTAANSGVFRLQSPYLLNGSLATPSDGQTCRRLLEFVTGNQTEPHISSRWPIWRATPNSCQFSAGDYFPVDAVLNSSAGTMGARFRKDLATGGQAVMAVWNGTVPNIAQLFINGSGEGLFTFGDIPTYVESGTDLRSASVYHSMIATWDATDAWFYIDGVEVHTASFTSTGPIAAYPYIGSRRRTSTPNPDSFLTGNISNAIVSGGTASAAQVAALHAFWNTF